MVRWFVCARRVRAVRDAASQPPLPGPSSERVTSVRPPLPEAPGAMILVDESAASHQLPTCGSERVVVYPVLPETHTKQTGRPRRPWDH